MSEILAVLPESFWAVQVLNGRNLTETGKASETFAAADTGGTGDIVNGKGLFKVRLDIAHHFSHAVFAYEFIIVSRNQEGPMQ